MSLQSPPFCGRKTIITQIGGMCNGVTGGGTTTPWQEKNKSILKGERKWKESSQKKLMDALRDAEESKAKSNLDELGSKDTAKLNRLEFRKLFGKMAGIEASNTNKEHTEIKIGRLCVLENILGQDKFRNLMNTLGTLCEEYLFGLPGGEPSEYRIAEANVTLKDGE